MNDESVSAEPSRPAPEFSLIAGHAVLDLCNTLDWRLEPDSHFERLPAYSAVLAWSQAVGLLTSTEARAIAGLPELTQTCGSQEASVLRELRESAYRVIVLRARDDADALARMMHDAVATCRLTPVGPSWAWAEPALSLATPRRRILFQLVDLMRSPAMKDVRQCADVSCGWVYLDTSPRRNRKWCVARDCGNRNRVRRHYQRRRDDAVRALLEDPRVS